MTMKMWMSLLLVAAACGSGSTVAPAPFVDQMGLKRVFLSAA